MSLASELRERLQATKARLREVEDAALEERRRSQELNRAYSETSRVRSTALPPGFNEQRGN